MYWDAASKTYIPVPGGNPTASQPMIMTAEDQAILSNPAADAPLEMKKALDPPDAAEDPEAPPLSDAGSAADSLAASSSAAPERKDDDDSKKDKDSEKPRSLAAVKVALCLQYRCERTLNAAVLGEKK